MHIDMRIGVCMDMYRDVCAYRHECMFISVQMCIGRVYRRGLCVCAHVHTRVVIDMCRGACMCTGMCVYM